MPAISMPGAEHAYRRGKKAIETLVTLSDPQDMDTCEVAGE